jgi:capsular polysaccharide biosynthesis protein
MYGDLPYGLFILPNASVRGGDGFVFTHEDLPIVEQNAGLLRKKKFVRAKFDEVSESIGEPLRVGELVSLVSRCNDCFWHWMMDNLPKVMLAEECGFKGAYLLPPSSTTPWATESMKLMRISSERVVYADQRGVQADRLYVPSYFCGFNAHHNIPFMKMYRDWVRAAISANSIHGEERIFIGRRESAKVRRVVNQVDVEQLLKGHGVRTLYFEDLSLRAQLELACATKVMVAPHGSGLSHSLFMNERSVLIEFFPYKGHQACDCYETLSQVINHRYRSLESVGDRAGDIEVNLEDLNKILTEEL